MTRFFKALVRPALGLCLLPLWADQTIEFSANMRFSSRIGGSQQRFDSSSATDDRESVDEYMAHRSLSFKATRDNWNFLVAWRIDQGDISNPLSFAQDPAGSTRLYWPDRFTHEAFDSWSRVCAEARYSFGQEKHSTVAMGYLLLPEISSERAYYQPYIGTIATERVVGSVLRDQGLAPALSMKSSVGLINYEIAAWQQSAWQGLSALPTTSIAGTVAENQTANTLSNFANSYSSQNGDTISSPALDRLNTTLFENNDFGRAGASIRLSLTQDLPGHASYALGIGAALMPLNHPLLLNTIALFRSDSDSAQYSTTSFQKLAQWAIDTSVVMSNIQINMGYQYQKMLVHDSEFFPAINGQTNQNTAAAEAFNQSGLSTGFWVETGYLLGAGQYDLDQHKGVISGVSLRSTKPVVELTARYGLVHHRNVNALADYVGHQDFQLDSTGTALASPEILNAEYWSGAHLQKAVLMNIDNTGSYSTQITNQNSIAYEHKHYGWLISTAVHFSEQLSFRCQYQQQHYSYRKHFTDQPQDLAWTASFNHRQVTDIQLGCEYMC